MDPPKGEGKRKREAALSNVCEKFGYLQVTGVEDRGRVLSPPAMQRSKSILKKKHSGSRVRFTVLSDFVMFDERNLREVQTCLHPTGDAIEPPKSVVLFQLEDADLTSPTLSGPPADSTNRSAKRGPNFYHTVREHEREEGKRFCDLLNVDFSMLDDEDGIASSFTIEPTMSPPMRSRGRQFSTVVSPELQSDEKLSLASPPSPATHGFDTGSVGLSSPTTVVTRADMLHTEGFHFEAPSTQPINFAPRSPV